MPSKKRDKVKATPSVTRGRSKSAGRAASQTRSRTPRSRTPRSRTPRSRSRSRVSPVRRKTRTPASESKLRRSSSSSSGGDVEIMHVTRKVATTSTNGKRQASVSLTRDSIPSRFSQRIIQKIETTRPQQAGYESFHTQSKQHNEPSSYPHILSDLRERVCTSPITAALAMVFSVLFTFWLNFVVLSPASGAFLSKPKAQSSKWGAGYAFLGVIWPTDWHLYFNLPSVGFVLSYVALHALFARLLPIGRKVSSTSESRCPDYQCNGLATAFVFFGVFSALQYGVFNEFGHMKPSSYIMKYWIGMLSSTTVLIVAVSIAVTLTMRRIPRTLVFKQGNTGNFIIDMLNGRSTRPRWCNIDWKMLIIRLYFMTTVMVTVCCGCIQWEQYRRITPALSMVIVADLVQLVDFLIFEHTALSWYCVRREGFGFATMFFVCQNVFLHSIAPIYLSTRPDVGLLTTPTGNVVVGNVVLLCLAALVFAVGYWIYNSSNRQKDLFYRQPNHSSFSGMPKVTGIQSSNRILAGGWWGVVRHPNILGNLLMLIGMTLPTGCYSMVPWCNTILWAFLFQHVIFRTEHAESEAYGLTFEMYKKLVPYKLIPKVY